MAGPQTQWLLILVGALLAVPVTSAITVDVATPHPAAPTDESPARLAPTPTTRDDRGDTEEEKDGIVFRCPDALGQGEVRANPPNTQIYYGCPIRIEDGGDLFGNIELVISPDNPNDLAFLSLHGQADLDLTNRSRSGQTHTAFVSADGGEFWYDNPHNAPRGWRGESATGVFDGDGNIYIGYQYALEREGRLLSVLELFKGGGVGGGFRISDAYDDPYTFNEHDLGGWVDDARMVFVDRFDPPEDDTASGENETPQQGWGDLTDPKEARPAAVMTVWHTTDTAESEDNRTGWIDAAWTDTRSRNQWTRLAEKERIGPCMDASNPVSYHGRVYVACTVDKGYKDRKGARIAEVDVWRIDPSTGRSKLMGYTGLEGIDPLLTVSPDDGYFVALATEPLGLNGLSVRVSFSWYGVKWSSGTSTGGLEMGPLLHSVAGNRPEVYARVTGIAVTPLEKTVFLLYQEQRRPSDDLETGPPEPDLDGSPRDDHARVVLTFNECEYPIAATTFSLGSHVITSDPGPQLTWADPATTEPRAFQDLHDGLAYRYDAATREELVYFAINDHGIAQFGAMVARASGSPCNISPIPPVPVPTAVAVATTSTQMLSTGAGVLSAAMIGYLLMLKRRNPFVVATGAR